MIRQQVTVGLLAASSANLYVTSVTPVSGTALTLTGSAPAVARRVAVAAGSEASARTLAVVGTNNSGATIKETIAIPASSATTYYTVQDYATVISLTPLGGGWTAAATVGTNGVVSSPWNVVDTSLTPVNISIGCYVTGTVNYSIEYTYDDLNALSAPFGALQYTVPTVFALSTLSNKTQTADGFINDPIWAWRLTVNSGALNSATSSVTAVATQGGIRQ